MVWLWTPRPITNERRGVLSQSLLLGQIKECYKMKYMDIKPQPTDKYTKWQEMKNRVKADSISIKGRHIEVSYLPKFTPGNNTVLLGGDK
jgi:hypothetical protein